MKLRSILFSLCGYVLLLASAVNAEPTAVVSAQSSSSSSAAATLSSPDTQLFAFSPVSRSSGLLLAPPPPPYSCANECWSRYVSCQNAGGFLCNHKYTMCLRSCSGPILPSP
jgi:hypothetical protein